MRLLRFELLAYAHFTGKVLEFRTELPGLHLVYGPNEAGKSSALRALKCWLYGFPERTPDDFLHPYTQLLLAGVLRGGDGRLLDFQRRKRRKDDLLNREGIPLDPASLQSMLRGLLPEVFDSLHGIDHDSLVRGGEAILEQKGELGQALFASGSGLNALRELQQQLDNEAEELYRPRGQNQQIARLLRLHEALRRRISAESISAGRFRELEEQLEHRLLELQLLEKRLVEMKTDKRRWERLLHALPLLGQRKRLQEMLAVLGQVPRLPPDFPQRRRDVESRLRERVVLRDAAAKQLAEVRQRLDLLVIPHPLLHKAQPIDELTQRLGSHLKAHLDRRTIQGLKSSDREAAESLLTRLRPDLTLDQAGTLRPLLGRRRTIEEMVACHAALESGGRQAREQLRRLAGETQKIREHLEHIGPEDELASWREAVVLARQAGDVDAVLERLERQAQTDGSRWANDLAKLGLWQGNPAAAISLALPDADTLQHAEQAQQELEQRIETLRHTKADADARLSRIAVELAALHAAGTVPGEESLLHVRQKRDEGWRLVCRQWLEHEDVSKESLLYDRQRPLHEAYIARVAEADDVADRLRREADRVQRASRLQVERSQTLTDLQRLSTEESSLQNELTELHTAWRNSWAPLGIAPRTPAAMRRWLADFRELRLHAAELGRLDQEFARLREERSRIREHLAAALTSWQPPPIPPDSRLSPLLQWAGKELEIREEREQRRRSLLDRLRDLERRRDELAKGEDERLRELHEWQQRWQDITAALTGNRRLLPTEAGEALDLLQECFNRLDQVKGHEKRLEGIDRDARIFSLDLSLLADMFLPGTPTGDHALLVSLLREKLAEARRLETQEIELRRTAAELEKRLQDDENAMAVLQAELVDLCRMAGCERPEELDDIELRHVERHNLSRRLEECETALLENAGGVSLDEFAGMAAGIEIDQLPERIAAADREIDNTLTPRGRQLAEATGRLQQELEQLRGQQGAAALAADAAAIEAGLRGHYQSYLRLTAASAVLAREIERYRLEHQGPLLQLASDFFRRLTRGAFQGLRADENEAGHPVLVGLRGTSAPAVRHLVEVDHMSSGTRDQLYLALRLAALRHRLTTDEAMPLIVDDILVNFDDDRSQAALEVFADLARQVQVILFTHHRRLWRQAEVLLNVAPERIQLHDLGAA